MIYLNKEIEQNNYQSKDKIDHKIKVWNDTLYLDSIRESNDKVETLINNWNQLKGEKYHNQTPT